MKGVVLPEYSLGYRGLPKTASSTIKYSIACFFENGCEDGYLIKDGIPTDGHKYFKPSMGVIDKMRFRFIVLRDPIKRFLSMYNDRVLAKNELDMDFLQEKQPLITKEFLNNSIPFRPFLSDFIKYIIEYRKTISIGHHMTSIFWVTRGSLDIFTNIYKIEELNNLEKDLKDVFKDDSFSFINRNVTADRSKKYFGLRNLKEKDFEWLLNWYQKDYELVKDFYPIENIKEEYRLAKNKL
jgi:hypothetical protein